MSKLYIIIVIVSLVSCCELGETTTYKYRNITIIRKDVCGKTTFYYSDGSKGSTGKIWAEYSGINSGFSGYLKFNDSGKVMLLSGDGYFQTEDVDTSVFSYRRILSYERPKLGPGVYYVTFPREYEPEENKNVPSEVKAEYKKD